MTTDDFTTAAAAEGQARIAAMLEVAGASADIRAWFPAGFEKGAVWARDHLAAQEPTDAEVDAAATAWEAHGPAEFHESEGEMCCRECGEAFDWIPLDVHRFDARQRAHRFRAALAAARAVRQEKR